MMSARSYRQAIVQASLNSKRTYQMTTLILVVVVLALLWRFGYWPFDGSYPKLPRYGVAREAKVEPPEGPKPGV
jgi:hypothetical protein